MTGSIVCRGGAGAGLGSSAEGGAGSCHHGEHCHTYTGSRPYTCRVYSIQGIQDVLSYKVKEGISNKHPKNMSNLYFELNI